MCRGYYVMLLLVFGFYRDYQCFVSLCYYCWFGIFVGVCLNKDIGIKRNIYVMVEKLYKTFHHLTPALLHASLIAYNAESCSAGYVLRPLAIYIPVDMLSRACPTENRIRRGRREWERKRKWERFRWGYTDEVVSEWVCCVFGKDFASHSHTAEPNECSVIFSQSRCPIKQYSNRCRQVKTYMNHSHSVYSYFSFSFALISFESCPCFGVCDCVFACWFFIFQACVIWNFSTLFPHYPFSVNWMKGVPFIKWLIKMKIKINVQCLPPVYEKYWSKYGKQKFAESKEKAMKYILCMNEKIPKNNLAVHVFLLVMYLIDNGFCVMI